MVEVVDRFRLPCLEDEAMGLGLLEEVGFWEAIEMLSVKREKNGRESENFKSKPEIMPEI